MASDYEYVYDGLTFGGSTIYAVTLVEGLTEPPLARLDASDRPGAHGGFFYSDYYDTRIITFTGEVSDPSTYEASVLALKTMMLPEPLDKALVFKLPNTVQQRINCKPARFAIPFDDAYNLKVGRFVAQFQAQDPRIYADTASTAAILTSGGTVVAANAGNVDTYFETAIITGPGTTFTVKVNGSATLKVVLNATLTGGQTATINFQKRTIVRSDGTNLYGNLDVSSLWWPLTPGNTTVQFTVGSGSTGATRLDMTWRSAWM